MTSNPKSETPRTRAAFTVVSKNYLAQARVLARSYLAHHPDHRFIVVLADELDSDYDGTGEQFELVLLRSIPLPARDSFVYQYTILELNTAVKPFCYAYFLNHLGLEGLLYIDPDIMVFRPLEEAWQALVDHDVVMTPHMREPFADRASPSELAILQSGTYNLGFLGLRNGEVARKLLAWWSERLYTDCVVDIPRGLFVDQKWMDLVPAYFEQVKILRDPTYNVAYWNLHERVIEHGEDGFMVDGAPLTFFHFSGYSPLRADRLSKHQTRHALADLPAVKALCDVYADALWTEGHASASQLSYAYGRLLNGVRATRAINAVVLHCVRNRIAFPSPGLDADGFCRFLTTPNPAVFGKDVAPIVTAVLALRNDVSAAFPAAASDKHDSGFLTWICDNGAIEEQLETLIAGFGDKLTMQTPYDAVLDIHDARGDLRDAYPATFSDDAQYQEFRNWLTTFGRSEEGVDDAMVESFELARSGFSRVLDAYFGRLDLLAAFPFLYRAECINALVEWFSGELQQFPGMTLADVHAFDRVAQARRKHLLRASLRYNPAVRAQIGGLPSALNFDAIRACLAANGAEREVSAVMDDLLSGDWIDPMSQFIAFCSGNAGITQQYPRVGIDPVDTIECARVVIDRNGFRTGHSNWNGWVACVLEACRRPLRQGVNLIGYLGNTTGVGESARSMLRKLDAAAETVATTILAGTFKEHEAGIGFNLAGVYGGHAAMHDTNVVVANADDFQRVRDWLPNNLWQGRHNVGYWVWETEALPAQARQSARGLDAIWTPSRYSAEAIRKVVDIPVRVIPHSLDFEALSRARPDRAAFGLQPGALLFGYFFDSKSEYERKNPAGLIDAFRLAFGDRTDVCLVLKVNSPTPGRYEYEQLKMRALGLNVVWLESTLDRDGTNTLMATLDAYVSLHRAEGFGLTMAEAMAMGKPVIATGYSGNLEFMNADSALLVDHSVIATTRPFGPYPAGTRWAQPSIEHAAALMNELCDARRRKQLGEAGQRHIRDVLGILALSTRLSDALGELRSGTP